MTQVERVQRIVEGDLPVLHVEPEVPRAPWTLHVDGLVDRPVELGLDELPRLGTVRKTIDLHCVWGWSRPGLRWEGIPVVLLERLVEPRPAATYVVFTARSSPYASCFTLDEARDGLLAWALGDEPLATEHGGPLRLVPPSHKWAYKAVKWVESITFCSSFSPGFWEESVGDPRGDIPWDVLHRLGRASDRWKEKP